jgi:hypothetical protein
MLLTHAPPLRRRRRCAERHSSRPGRRSSSSRPMPLSVSRGAGPKIFSEASPRSTRTATSSVVPRQCQPSQATARSHRHPLEHPVITAHLFGLQVDAGDQRFELLPPSSHHQSTPSWRAPYGEPPPPRAPQPGSPLRYRPLAAPPPVLGIGILAMAGPPLRNALWRHSPVSFWAASLGPTDPTSWAS